MLQRHTQHKDSRRKCHPHSAKHHTHTHTERLAAHDQLATLAKHGDHQRVLSALAAITDAEQRTAARAPTARAAARLANQLALAAMQDSHSTSYSLDAAHAYLRLALALPALPVALQAVSLNNLAIFYSRTAQPHKALRCLQRVSRYGPLSGGGAAAGGGAGANDDDDVEVHVALNLTTVLADLGRHPEALEMAQEAVAVLERRAAPDAGLMSAAYYNLAVQQERLGSKSGFRSSYRAALSQARRSGAGGGDNSQMAEFINATFHGASRPARSASAAGGRAPGVQPGAINLEQAFAGKV